MWRCLSAGQSSPVCSGMATKLLALSTLLFTALGSAQTDWRFHLTAQRPSIRSGHGLAFDTQRNKLVLFGGFAGFAPLGDLWEFDGSNWQQRVSIAGPTPRMFHTMTYMPQIGRVLLFGGRDVNGTTLGDTWLYDGTSWLQIPTQFSDPEPRTDAALTSDTRSNVALLYGGGDGTRTFAGLWAFNGVGWFRLGGPVEPPARSRSSLAYDLARDRTVLFGGANGTTLMNDTWEWDGRAWRLVSPDTRPTPRAGHGAAYDPFRRRVVVFGGSTSAGVTNETFDYEGSAYFPGPSAISPRFLSPLAFDANLRRVVLIGGQARGSFMNDTESYGAVNPATFTPYGSGCAGTAGTPALAAAPFSVPYLFTTLRMQVRSIPAAAPVAMVLGASNSTFQSAPLPLSLASFGMPGCALLASLDVLVPTTTAGTTATLDLLVPFDLALVGQSFFTQAVVFDPTANVLGLTVSNGGAARIGKLD
jgi:hypothetical protein